MRELVWGYEELTEEMRSSLLAPLCHVVNVGDKVSLVNTDEPVKARILCVHDTDTQEDLCFVLMPNTNLISGRVDAVKHSLTVLHDGQELVFPLGGNANNLMADTKALIEDALGETVEVCADGTPILSHEQVAKLDFVMPQAAMDKLVEKEPELAQKLTEAGVKTEVEVPQHVIDKVVADATANGVENAAEKLAAIIANGPVDVVVPEVK